MKKSIKQVIGKRIASIMMSAVLAVAGVGLLPQFSMSVHAVPVQSYDISSASVNETFNDDCTIEITGSTHSNTVQIDVASGKTVTVILDYVFIDLRSVDYACAFRIIGSGNVILYLVEDNSLYSGLYCAGLQKDSTGTLTITGTGTLTSTGGSHCAGIGGGYNADGSDIYISGGTVNALGGAGAGGIGGGYNADGSNIHISGGTVTASGRAGAGIGGGQHGDGSNIHISGGTVTASGNVGAGIGGGYNGDGSDIYISGGTVTATGSFGAGIGGGYNGDGSNIEISGGTITATARLSGAGIGGGYNGDGFDISISGSSNVFVSGGLDSYTANYPNEIFGYGAAIGSGGYTDSNNSPVNGTEIDPDISGLNTNGSIKYYPAGTSATEISNGSVQPTSTVTGTVSVVPPAPSTSELELEPEVVPEPEPPVNYMQEVEEQINAAISLGGPQTVTIKGYDTLSYDVLKLLKEHPQITLISEFTYKDVDFKLTIPGNKVELNPEIRWYGPKCLYPMFYLCSTDTYPEVNTYIAMFK